MIKDKLINKLNLISGHPLDRGSISSFSNISALLSKKNKINGERLRRWDYILIN